MPIGRRSEATPPRRLSSTANLQPQSRVESVRSGLNGWFNGWWRVGASRTRSSTPESPKTPRHIPGLQELRLPSTRLHIPYLSRSNSPASVRDSGPLASPPSFPHPFAPTASRPVTPNSLQQHTGPVSGETISPSSHHPSGPSFVGVDLADLRRANLAATERRKLTKSKRLCGPKVKNKNIRANILNCFISGIFLALVLTVYLVMALSSRNQSQEFHILLILIILTASIFFFHALIRLRMMIKKYPLDNDLEYPTLPAMVGLEGYANPVTPIPVALAGDLEAAGIESDATKLPPPAYGLWRESVRVDPNRIFWQRNQDVPPMSTRQAQGDEDRPVTANRPPSYVSEDGVEYVVEVKPRSMAPSYEVPLPPRPSERGGMSTSTLPRR